jgi:hypothetical protein
MLSFQLHSATRSWHIPFVAAAAARSHTPTSKNYCLSQHTRRCCEKDTVVTCSLCVPTNLWLVNPIHSCPTAFRHALHVSIFTAGHAQLTDAGQVAGECVCALSVRDKQKRIQSTALVQSANLSCWIHQRSLQGTHSHICIAGAIYPKMTTHTLVWCGVCVVECGRERWPCWCVGRSGQPACLLLPAPATSAYR